LSPGRFRPLPTRDLLPDALVYGVSEWEAYLKVITLAAKLDRAREILRALREDLKKGNNYGHYAETATRRHGSNS
jgi:hypothetical protein